MKMSEEEKEEMTDWLIAREECVEEDINILERFKNNEMQRDKLERDNRCGAWKIGDIYKHLELNTAINHILAERESDKKRIKDLEEENHLQRKQIMSAYDKGWIPKQKVLKEVDKLLNAFRKIEFNKVTIWNSLIQLKENLLEDK